MTEICSNCQAFRSELPQMPRAQYADFIKLPVKGGYIALRTERGKLGCQWIEGENLQHCRINFAYNTAERSDTTDYGRFIWRVGWLCQVIGKLDYL